MNIIFGTRGDARNTREIVEQINWFWMKTKFNKIKPDGSWDTESEPRDVIMTPSLKPVMLWDLQIPEEYRDLFLNNLFTKEGQDKYKKQSKYIKFVRKILRLKGFPEDIKPTPKMPWKLDNTDFVFIGLKEDGHWDNGVEKL